MTGFGWVADAVGPAESLIGLGMVLLLTAAVAVQCTRKTLAQRVASAS
jgi:MFS transporter, DHA3 family, macrolide efflux protein